MEETACECCSLPPVGGNVLATRLSDGAHICSTCRDHQGETQDMRRTRGRDHFALLRLAYLNKCGELKDAEWTIDELRHELATRPTQVRVRVENLDQEIVEAARAQIAATQAELDEAVRRRNTALGALSDVRLVHHKQPEGNRCTCGALYDKCETAQIVAWEPIKDWEQRNAWQGRHGQRHSLRPDHPAISEPDWFTDRDLA